jgi:hypothetical protein
MRFRACALILVLLAWHWFLDALRLQSLRSMHGLLVSRDAALQTLSHELACATATAQVRPRHHELKSEIRALASCSAASNNVAG